MDFININKVYEPYQKSLIYFKCLVHFWGNFIVFLESVQVGMKAEK